MNLLTSTAEPAAPAPRRPHAVSTALVVEPAYTTVLGRLEDQLRALGVPQVHVVHDAAEVTRHARDGAGGVLVLHGDVITQDEALAGLLAGGRTAALVAPAGSDGHDAR